MLAEFLGISVQLSSVVYSEYADKLLIKNR